MIRAIVVRPGAEPVTEEIAPGLRALQTIVGGLLERVPGPMIPTLDRANVVLWCWEEPSNDTPETLVLRQGVTLRGPVVATGIDAHGGTLGLDDAQHQLVLAWLKGIERPLTPEAKAALLLEAITTALDRGTQHRDPDTDALLTTPRAILECMRDKGRVVLVPPPCPLCGEPGCTDCSVEDVTVNPSEET